MQIDHVIFGCEPDVDAIGKSDVTNDPVGGGEGFGGKIGGVPEEFGALVLDPGGGELENSPFVDLDQQEAIAHLEQQGVAFLVLQVDVPIFDRLIVDAQQGLLDGLPSDGFVGGKRLRGAQQRASE